MNLRDKLRALESAGRKPSPPPRQYTGCYERAEDHPMEDFPHALALRRETVTLMQGEAMPDPLDPRRILYLDTETTGFMGAGTVAFLVGTGRLTEDGFTVRQFLMRDYPEEPFLLARLEKELAQCDAICTFNGRSFDMPLLRDRFLMNRMRPACLEKPHIDLLHIARRVWKLRLKQCSLGRLEEAVLGITRQGDIPGAQVPQRYFSFLKTGQFDLLREVIAHNAQDIASLCVLLAHMARMYEHPEEQPHAEDVYAMGVALERFHHPEEARRCYRLASRDGMRAQGQLRLAQSWRRAGQRDEAAAVWQGMIARHEGGILPYVELAKHLEHIQRDIPQAIEMTRRAMMLLAEPTLLEPEDIRAQREALAHRYERLKRKLEKE